LIGAGADRTVLIGNVDTAGESTFLRPFLGGLTIRGTVRADALFFDDRAEMTISNSIVRGGAILVEGGNGNWEPASLRLSKSIVENGHGWGVNIWSGGAIFVDAGRDTAHGGQVEVYRSTIRNNVAQNGGAIWVGGGQNDMAKGGSVTISRSLLTGNHAAQSGGAIYLDRDFATNTTEGTVTIGSSTLAGNTAVDTGGAIGVHINVETASTMIVASTIAGNSADRYGGLQGSSTYACHGIRGSILAGNADSGVGPDCSGLLDSLGSNLILDEDGCTILYQPNDLVGIDPLLGPLDDNGGFTRTRAPLEGSPAIDANATPCGGDDQRDVARPQGDSCDIGAVEVAPDADGDGIPDLLDECPADPDKTTPGVCGCGVPEQYTDVDGDGVLDCLDPCPTDPDDADPDSDGDGYSLNGHCSPDGLPDCDDGNPATYPGAIETNDGADNQCPGDAGFGLIDETGPGSGFHDPLERNEYSWPAQPGADGYEVARAGSADMIDGCVIFATGAPLLVAPTEPAAGAVLFYLNRAASPHTGSWGRGLGDDERTVPCAD
jgi:hypothetical protein